MIAMVMLRFQRGQLLGFSGPVGWKSTSKDGGRWLSVALGEVAASSSGGMVDWDEVAMDRVL